MTSDPGNSGQQPYGQPAFGQEQPPYGQQPSYGQQQPSYGQQPLPADPGYGQAPYGQPAYPVAAKTNVLAILSLVAALVGLFTFGLLSIVGLILGFIGRSQVKQRGENGRGLATAGIIISIVTLVLGVVGTLLIIAAVHRANVDDSTSMLFLSS